MRKSDFIVGIIWMALGIAIAWRAYRLGLGTLMHPGLGLVPFILGIFILFFSTLILILSHDVKGALTQVRYMWSDIDVKRIGLVLLYLIGYAITVEKIGYLITTFIFLFLLSKTISLLRLRASLLISLISVLISYLLFVTLLNVPLPSGLWRVG